MFYNVYLIFINGSNVFKMCVFYYISVEKSNMFINKAILKNALINMSDIQYSGITIIMLVQSQKIAKPNNLKVFWGKKSKGHKQDSQLSSDLPF